jgi:putative flippase GtrA
MFAQLFRFGIVGIIGFCVDGGLLFVIMTFYNEPYFIRLISFPAAVTVTWYLNRNWTFTSSSSREIPQKEYQRYLMVQIVGAMTNYLFFLVTLKFIEQTPLGALFALAIGSLAGLLVNFLGAHHFVFLKIK